MADLATLQQRLADAESAYHDLATGTKATVVVDQNGERVEFARPRLSDLRAYIASLQAEIAKLQGVAITGGCYRPFF